MENYGKSLRELRLNLNLSQLVFSNGVMSQSNYSKIEKNLVEVTFTHLVQLLDNINMTVQEFLWIHSGHQNAQSSIDDIYMNRSKGLDYLIKLKQKITDDARTSVYDREALSIIDAMLLIADMRWKEAMDSVEYIWQRLEKVDHYYYYDLKVLNMILHIHPVDTAYQLYKMTRQSAEHRSHSRDIQNILENMHTNIILMLIVDKRYQEALDELEIQIPNLIKHNFLLKLAYSYIRKGYVLKLLKQDSEGNWINIGFDILKHTEKHFEIIQMKAEMEDKLAEASIFYTPNN